MEATLKLKLDGKEVELSLEDARKLRDMLNELFQETATLPDYPINPIPPHIASPPYPQPQWTPYEPQDWLGQPIWIAPITTTC